MLFYFYIRSTNFEGKFIMPSKFHKLPHRPLQMCLTAFLAAF